MAETGITYKAFLLDGVYTEWTIKNKIILINELCPFKASGGNFRARAAYSYHTSGTEDEIFPEVIAKRTPLCRVSISNLPSEGRDTPSNNHLGYLTVP